MVLLTNKLQKILTSSLLLFGIIFFCLIFLSSIVYTLPLYESNIVLILTIIGTIVFVLISSYLINKYLSKGQFIIFLLGLGFIIRLIWIGKVDTQPVSDFLYMFNSAMSALNGDLSFGTNEYFSRWVYQLGFTFYQAIILNVFGEQLFILKIFNIFFNIGIAIVIYFTTSKLFNDYSGRVASLLYTIYLPNIVFVSVLTNQHLSTFLFFLGIYFLIKHGIADKYSWLIIGVSFGLGNIFRPMGSFFLLGLLVFVVVYKIFPIKKQTIYKYGVKLVGIFVVYFMVQQIVSYGLISSGVTDKSLSNQDPYWKFVVGLNQEKNGMWNRTDNDYVEQFELGEERKQAEMELIKERLSDKSELITLMKNKFEYFWGGVDTSSYWSLVNINMLDLKNIVDKYERVGYLILTIFAFISMVLLLRKKDIQHSSMLLLLILLGGYFLIHIIIEIQTRYRFDIMPVFFILVGFGIYSSNQFIKQKVLKPLREKNAE